MTYPETADLARVLAMPHWRHPTSPATKHEVRQFRRDINQYLGIRYRPENSSYDPLFSWFQKRHAPASSRRFD